LENAMTNPPSVPLEIMFTKDGSELSYDQSAYSYMSGGRLTILRWQST
jgi:hypothetical protein